MKRMCTVSSRVAPPGITGKYTGASSGEGCPFPTPHHVDGKRRHPPLHIAHPQARRRGATRGHMFRHLKIQLQPRQAQPAHEARNQQRGQHRRQDQKQQIIGRHRRRRRHHRQRQGKQHSPPRHLVSQPPRHRPPHSRPNLHPPLHSTQSQPAESASAVPFALSSLRPLPPVPSTPALPAHPFRIRLSLRPLCLCGSFPPHLPTSPFQTLPPPPMAQSILHVQHSRPPPHPPPARPGLLRHRPHPAHRPHAHLWRHQPGGARPRRHHHPHRHVRHAAHRHQLRPHGPRLPQRRLRLHLRGPRDPLRPRLRHRLEHGHGLHAQSHHLHHLVQQGGRQYRARNPLRPLGRLLRPPLHRSQPARHPRQRPHQ